MTRLAGPSRRGLLLATGLALGLDATPLRPAVAQTREYRHMPLPARNGPPQEVSVAEFGATGAGSDAERDTAAFAEAFRAGAGGAIRVPPGRYLLKPGVLSLPSQTSLRGAGYGSVLEKTTHGPMLRFAGPRPWEHEAYGLIRDLRCVGKMLRGPLLDIRFCNNLVVENVYFENNDDTAVSLVEVWDSRFVNCVFEWTGGAAGRPAVHIRNSPPDRQGRSFDNSNQIHFTGCRWEQFRDGALWLGAAGESNVVNGIYLVNCKMETSHLNGPILQALGITRGLFIQNLYLAVNALGEAARDRVDLIDLRTTTVSSISNLHVYTAVPTRSTIRLREAGTVAINAVFQDGDAAPAVAVVDLDEERLRAQVGQVFLASSSRRPTVAVTR